MKTISNSTPLIYLAKLNKFNIISKIFKTIIIPDHIYNEVVLKGKELNKPETIIIENLIKKKFIVIENTVQSIKIDTLHEGEKTAISLALESGIKNILIDDKEGVKICEILGLKPFRTTALLLESLKRNLITLKEFENCLIELSNNGYFMSADVFKFLLEKAKEYNKK